MKKYFLILLLNFVCVATFAQKFAYIDTEYILKNIPDYQDAQKELDAVSKQWQNDIERKEKAIEKLYKDYQAEEILLTEKMKDKRREAIAKQEDELREFQKAKFGVDGELFKKRKELVKPIQEKIYKAVQETANIGRYSIIFDKSSRDATIVYSNPKYDKSDDILRRMGYEPGEENSRSR